MPSFSWDTGSYGGSAFVTTAGWGWYNQANESFPSARLAANGNRPILVSSISFLGGGGGSKTARFNAFDGAGERTSGLVANPSTFRFVVRANAGGTTTFLRNTGATGNIQATNTADVLSGQLPGSVTYVEVPTAPTITSLTQASLTEAQVVWSAPSDNGGSAVTGYRVDWSTSSTFASGVNTSTVGAVLSTTLTGITPGTTIYVRVAAINSCASAASTTSVFSSSSNVTMVASPGDVDGWASYGTDPSGITPLITGGIRRGTITPLGSGKTGLIREYTQTGSGGPTTAGARGIQRTFTGLTIGETYRVNGTAISMSGTTPSTATYRWAVSTIGNGSYGTITDDSTPVAIPEYQFVATGTSHVVQLQAGAASWSGAGYFERVGFYDITLEYVPNPTDYYCQDVELETSLANHYTVACATVGAAWWVGADNVTRFRQAEDTPGLVATFSDTAAPSTIPYSDVAVSQSTKNIANILTVTNYGPEEDVTSSFTDDDSVAAWGPREATLAMSLWDAETYLPSRADEVFARMSIPHRSIRSVTFNAQENLAVVQALEIQSRVGVTFEGVTDTLRVVGVRHELTPDRWFVTLYLSLWGYPEATSSGIGISSLSDHTVTGSQLSTAISAVTSVREIQTFQWANSTERNAQTGMVEGDIGYRDDINWYYKYTGSSWGQLIGVNQIVPSAATNGTVGITGLVTSTSASGIVRVRDCFPSGYTVFEVLFDIETAAGLDMRLALDATDATTAYDNQRLTSISTTTASVQALNAGIMAWTSIGGTGRVVGRCVLFGPNVADETVWISKSTKTPNPMTTSFGEGVFGGQHRTATAYNSLTMVPPSGNFAINSLVVRGLY